MNQRRSALGNFAPCLTGGLLVVLASLKGVAPAVAADQRTERQPAGRPSNALSIEAESLVGSAQPNQGQVVVQNMQGFGSGWSGGAQLFWGGAQSGAQLRLSFPTTVTGRYEIFLHFTRGPDFAIVRANLDGAPAVTFNGYAPTVSRDRVLLGMRDLTPRPHQLRLDVTSKDGKSAGFNVGLDRIELEPVGDRTTSRNPPGALGRSADAGVGSATIPVLRIPAGSTLRDEAPVQQAIEPLSMSARVETTRKALSSTSSPLGQPGTPIRLSASDPQVGSSGLRVVHGAVFAAPWATPYINVLPDSTLELQYGAVEPGRPHLFECGYSTLSVGLKARLSANLLNHFSVQPKYADELATFPLVGGSKPQRLLAVVAPSQPDLHLALTLADGSAKGGFSIWYCELTPFK